MTGAAIAKWTEGGGRSSVTYQGEESFINSVNYFFGKEGAEPIEVSAGVHLYKFSCRIPKNAPATAEGLCGFIRYRVLVNLDIPYMPDLSSEKHFTVVRHEDLNNYPEFRMANDVEEVQTFCCLFCESDPVMVKLSTAASGFILGLYSLLPLSKGLVFNHLITLHCHKTQGEKVPVKIEIFNRSSVKFAKSILSLNRVEVFTSYNPLQKTKKVVNAITTVVSKGVEPKKNASFQEYIHIPQNALVSNDRICDVFQITYEIHFSMKGAKKSSSIKLSAPIFIGSIGFRSNSTASRTSIDVASKPISDDLRKCNMISFHVKINDFIYIFCSSVLQVRWNRPQLWL